MKVVNWRLRGSLNRIQKRVYSCFILEAVGSWETSRHSERYEAMSERTTSRLFGLGLGSICILMLMLNAFGG